MRITGTLLSRRTLAHWLLGLLLLGALVLWVHFSVGWSQLLAPWLDFPPAWLALLFALTALSYLLRAVRVYDYSLHLLRGNFPATLRLSVLHNTLNNFLPMRLGELAYPILMRRYFGQGLTAGGVTLLWIRALDLHFLVLVGMAFTVVAGGDPRWAWLLLPWAALVPAMHWGHGRLRDWSAGREGRMHRLLGKVLGHVPDRAGHFYRIWLWTALSWVFKFVSYASVVLYFADIGLWKAVLGTIGAELSSVLPIHGIAGSGSYELAMAAVLLPLGVDMQTLLKAAVNLHLYLLGANLLLAAGAFLLPRPVGRT